MKSDTFFITNRFGEKLDSIKEYGSTNPNQPTVLMVVGIDHDYHERANSFDEISHNLVSVGFVVYRFSFAGSGKSEGDFSEMTLTRQAQQLQDVLDYMKHDKMVDSAKIGILAQSLGAATVITALPLEIASIVFLSPAIDPKNSIHDLILSKGEKFDPSGISLFPRKSGKVTKIGPEFWKEAEKIDLADRANNYLPESCLVLHGGKDDVNSEHEVIEFFCTQNPPEVHIVARGDHGFIDCPKNVRDNVLDEIVSWFHKKL